MSDEEELPHVVVDPWDHGTYGQKIEPPYGLVITAISDLRGWLRNCAEQTNTDEAGKEYKELVVPEIKVLALIDKLKEVGDTYLDEQRHDSNTYNEAISEVRLLHLGAEKKLVRSRHRNRELRAVNKGLRLAIRELVIELEEPDG